MSRLSMAAGAACCFVAFFSSPALASDPAQCWRPYEIEAAKVRDLHIMLMLGSLKCKSTINDISSKYDAFVGKKNEQLNNYNVVLRARFMRTNGISDGHRAFEEFNTKLGNSHSGASQTGNYCQITETLLALATDARDQELPLLAQNFSEDRLGMQECEAVPARTTSATVAIVAAPPVTEAGKEEAATAPSSAAAALEAAAAALQTAAASLKAQPATPAPTEKSAPAADSQPQPALLRPVAAAETPTG